MDKSCSKFHSRFRLALLALFGTLMMLVAAACQPSGPSAATPGPVVATIQVTEKNFNIALDTDVVPPGNVKFVISNHGPDQHEFVIINTDLAATNLPVDYYTYKVKEDQLNEAYNHDHFPAGQTVEAVVPLQPGHYDVMCNLAGHYLKGMHASFTVSQNPGPTQTAQAEATQTAPTATPTPTTQPTPASVFTSTLQTVEVAINDSSLTANPNSVTAGSIMLHLNVEGSTMHGFAIVKTDLSADQLPVSNQAVNFGAEGVTAINELMGLSPGKMMKFLVNLNSGHYVLLDPMNYQKGVYAEFTVNAPTSQ